MNKNKNNKKKTSLAGIILIVVIFLRFIMNNGYSYEAVTALLGFALVLVPIAIPIVLLILAKKKKAEQPGSSPYRGYSASKKQTSGNHSHDRLSQNNLAAEHRDGIEHYKRQLDDFLAAGIIDRDEYKLMLNKYRKNLQ